MEGTVRLPTFIRKGKGFGVRWQLIPHQEIQGHRFPPHTSELRAQPPKLPNPIFVIYEATYFLPFMEAAGEFLAL